MPVGGKIPDEPPSLLGLELQHPRRPRRRDRRRHPLADAPGDAARVDELALGGTAMIALRASHELPGRRARPIREALWCRCVVERVGDARGPAPGAGGDGAGRLPISQLTRRATTVWTMRAVLGTNIRVTARPSRASIPYGTCATQRTKSPPPLGEST